MRRWFVWLLSALAIVALSLFIWDAYTEASGHPLMGALSHLLLWIAALIFQGASIAVALLLAPRQHAAHSDEAPSGHYRSSFKALPYGLLRSGTNLDPRAWDENENLPPDGYNW